MTFLTTKLRDLLVHHFHKCFPASGNMLRKGIGRLVAGDE